MNAPSCRHYSANEFPLNPVWKCACKTKKNLTATPRTMNPLNQSVEIPIPKSYPRTPSKVPPRARGKALASTSTYKKKYSEETILGKGAFSEVKLCKRRKTGDSFAVKILDLTTHQAQYAVTKTSLTFLERQARGNRLCSTRCHPAATQIL
jgi:hypothetical protein